ncbi:MAG: F0F1 ATP synthase subunit B [Patescibacteria group bacterium]|nr:F0F1 ATP synthase subunit B [Patescibacteria group bacterium]
MSEMLTKLGIDWRLFIAQLVNFLILFGILRAFAWKPIIMALEDRRAKIKKGLHDAEKAKQQVKDLEKEREAVLSEARAEAMAIIEKADQKASALSQEKIQTTQNEIEKRMEEAKEQIKGERTASYNALKQDLAKLISSATGKIVESMDSKSHDALIESAIKDLSAE